MGVSSTLIGVRFGAAEHFGDELGHVMGMGGVHAGKDWGQERLAWLKVSAAVKDSAPQMVAQSVSRSRSARRWRTRYGVRGAAKTSAKDGRGDTGEAA